MSNRFFPWLALICCCQVIGLLKGELEFTEGSCGRSIWLHAIATEVGTEVFRVEAVVKNANTSYNIDYHLIAYSEISSYFEISQRDGIIRTSKIFDRKNSVLSDPFILKVGARVKNTSDLLSESCTNSINIHFANIEFTDDLCGKTIPLNETMFGVGKEVFRVKAVVKNPSASDTINYRLLTDGSVSNPYFNIYNEKEGIVTRTNKIFNREVSTLLKQFNLIVEATAKTTSGTLSKSCNISISINFGKKNTGEINFTNDFCGKTIPLNETMVEVGKEVFRVEAIVRNEQMQSHIDYRLLTDGVESNPYFNISNEKGIVTRTNKIFDRKDSTLLKPFNLIVGARVNTTLGTLSNSCNISISINFGKKTINFTDDSCERTIRLDENMVKVGNEVFCVKAVMKNEDALDTIYYQLVTQHGVEPNPYFNISNRTEGKVTRTNKIFDRKDTTLLNPFNLKVAAWPETSNKGEKAELLPWVFCTNSISIQFANDSTPTIEDIFLNGTLDFTDDSCGRTIPLDENMQVGNEVFRVQAVVKNTNATDDFDYSLLPANPYFSISNKEGIVTRTSEIFDTEDSVLLDPFELKVRAMVRTTSEFLSENCTNSISIQFANDNAPKFIRVQYTSINVGWYITVDDVVLTVAAEDKDVGGSGAVAYSLQEYDAAAEFKFLDYFKVNSSTGQLALAKFVDFNKAPELITFKGYAVATDGGNPPKDSRALVQFLMKRPKAGEMASAEEQSSNSSTRDQMAAINSLLSCLISVFIALLLI